MPARFNTGSYDRRNPLAVMGRPVSMANTSSPSCHPAPIRRLRDAVPPQRVDGLL